MGDTDRLGLQGGNLDFTGTVERVVLVVASLIAVIGVIGVVSRELTAESDLPAGGRIRRVIEIIAPPAGLIGLIVWLWVG